MGERAESARKALPKIKANNMVLSEDLIASEPDLAPFESVTGFQAVEFDKGQYCTFEGNGRREALKRAFPEKDIDIKVEVRLFTFPDKKTGAAMAESVRMTRKWKEVED